MCTLQKHSFISSSFLKPIDLLHVFVDDFSAERINAFGFIQFIFKTDIDLPHALNTNNMLLTTLFPPPPPKKKKKKKIHTVVGCISVKRHLNS